jgi:hypothetical protein
MQCTCAVFSSVACPALQYYSTLSHKLRDFSREKKLLNIKCVLIFSVTFIWNTSRYKKNWTMYCHKWTHIGLLHVKYPLFLSDFNKTWIFLRQISEKRRNKEFGETGHVGAELFLVDRQTDMTKLTVAFRNFANAPWILLHKLRYLRLSTAVWFKGWSLRVRLDEQYLPAMCCCNCVADAWPAMLQTYSERWPHGSAT